MKGRYLKIPENFFDSIRYEVKVPTIKCWCGKEILDTPTNRLNNITV